MPKGHWTLAQETAGAMVGCAVDGASVGICVVGNNVGRIVGEDVTGARVTGISWQVYPASPTTDPHVYPLWQPSVLQSAGVGGGGGGRFAQTWGVGVCAQYSSGVILLSEGRVVIVDQSAVHMQGAIEA